jgi:hypothetical protein
MRISDLYWCLVPSKIPSIANINGSHSKVTTHIRLAGAYSFSARIRAWRKALGTCRHENSPIPARGRGEHWACWNSKTWCIR